MATSQQEKLDARKRIELSLDSGSFQNHFECEEPCARELERAER